MSSPGDAVTATPTRTMIMTSTPIVYGYVVTNEMLEEIAPVLIDKDELAEAHRCNLTTRCALIDWFEKNKYEHDILPLGWRNYRDGVPRFYNLWICVVFATRNDEVPNIPLQRDHFRLWWNSLGRLEITKTAWAHTMKYPRHLCIPEWMPARMRYWGEQAELRKSAKQGTVKEGTECSTASS